MMGPKYQRGYAVIPWVASLFTTAGAAGATGAAAGGAAAAAGTTAAVAGGAAATGAGLGTALATAAATGVAAVGASKLLAPKTPGLQPGGAPPSIDQAKQSQQTSDRLRTRRGVLANVFSGGSNPAAVGSKQLLGS